MEASLSSMIILKHEFDLKLIGYFVAVSSPCNTVVLVLKQNLMQFALQSGIKPI